jgi:hypothetical protein
MKIKLGYKEIVNFLNNYGIFHREHGKGYSKGNIYVDCPFCGAAGKGKQHTGIKPGATVYGCWKEPLHRGRDIVVLFSAITGVPYHVLQKDLAGLAISRYEGSFEEQLDELNHYNPINDQPTLELPEDFIPISQSIPVNIKDYLENSRGFKGEWLDKLGHDWGFGYTKQSYIKKGWSDPRIIIPTYSEGKLRGYTGRSIDKAAKMRYLACKGFKPQAAFYDQLMYSGGELLLIQEGSLDAIKFNLFGTKIKATALFTLTLANEWLLAIQLKNLLSRFKKCAILLDATDTATFAAYELGKALDLPVIDAKKILGIYKKLDGSPVKDTGDLTFSQLRAVEQTILEGLS